MLYNRPPTSSGQLPGYTTPSTNRQSVPTFSAMGEPALQTQPGGYNPGPSPSFVTSSTTTAPSSGNFATSNAPATNPGGKSTLGGALGSQPLGGDTDPGNMLTNNPPPNPGSNEATPMGSYFNSTNPSTMMRTMVGNTTQSGAAY